MAKGKPRLTVVVLVDDLLDLGPVVDTADHSDDEAQGHPGPKARQRPAEQHATSNTAHHGNHRIAGVLAYLLLLNC